jgi:Kef-type K+ transport system membrane component KefB
MNQHSFLFQAIIFLASAVIFVPIAKKLSLGSVLGYLLAGIVIGPFVFGFVGKEGEEIRHYAEFGVVMMLFVIGLELEPERLPNKKAKPVIHKVVTTSCSPQGPRMDLRSFHSTKYSLYVCRDANV